MRRRLLLVAVLLGCTLNVVAGKNHSYLFAWCGDDDKTASDFLAVIDADPASPGYGQVVATAPTGVAGSVPHHTEIEMPVGGLLMANGFEAGRTWVFDLREPLNPTSLRPSATSTDTCIPTLTSGCRTATFWRPSNIVEGMGRRPQAAACSRSTIAGTCSALAAPRTEPLLAS